jgi:cystathionine beta-lyase/cystathionine gamma-synthase
MTKFIGGHSDLTGGILSVKGKALCDRIYFTQVLGTSMHACSSRHAAASRTCCMVVLHALPTIRKMRRHTCCRRSSLLVHMCLQNAEGAILGPFDCWLALRGLKTMALRMERQVRPAGARVCLLAWLGAAALTQTDHLVSPTSFQLQITATTVQQWAAYPSS